jgi:hypothetical protein
MLAAAGLVLPVSVLALVIVLGLAIAWLLRRWSSAGQPTGRARLAADCAMGVGRRLRRGAAADFGHGCWRT